MTREEQQRRLSELDARMGQLINSGANEAAIAALNEEYSNLLHQEIPEPGPSAPEPSNEGGGYIPGITPLYGGQYTNEDGDLVNVPPPRAESGPEFANASSTPAAPALPQGSSRSGPDYPVGQGGPGALPEMPVLREPNEISAGSNSPFAPTVSNTNPNSIYRDPNFRPPLPRRGLGHLTGFVTDLASGAVDLVDENIYSPIHRNTVGHIPGVRVIIPGNAISSVSGGIRSAQTTVLNPLGQGRVGTAASNLANETIGQVQGLGNAIGGNFRGLTEPGDIGEFMDSFTWFYTFGGGFLSDPSTGARSTLTPNSLGSIPRAPNRPNRPRRNPPGWLNRANQTVDQIR